MEYDRTDTGALFKNDRKELDSQPDYKGSINVGAVEHWLSAWIKTSKDGKKFMSLSCKPKVEAKPKVPARATKLPTANELNDEIPF